MSVSDFQISTENKKKKQFPAILVEMTDIRKAHRRFVIMCSEEILVIRTSRQRSKEGKILI